MPKLFFQGWPLAVFCSLIFFVMNGMVRISGVLFPAVMSREGLNRGTASWPLNLQGAAIAIVSPITGLLGNRFSPSSIAAVGALVFSLGILPCYFSTNIYVLSIFFGIFRGCGMGIMATIALSSIATAYLQNRSTAMGLATAGMPVSGIVMPLLTQYFLDTYDLKSTFLLLTGISLHAFIGATGLLCYKRIHNLEFNLDKHRNIKNLPEEISNIASISSTTAYRSISSTNAPNSYEHGIRRSIFETGVAEENLLKSEKNLNGIYEINCTSTCTSNSIHNSRKEPSDPKPGGCSTSIQTPTEILLGDKPDLGNHSEFNKKTCMKIFTTRGFFLIAFTQIFIVYLGLTFSQVVVDYLVDKGIKSSQAVLMITMLSCGEIVGRLCFGWIADKNFLHKSTQMVMSLTLITVTTVICTFIKEYWLLMCCAVVLGVCEGSALSSSLVLVADYFNRMEVPLAMSFIRSFVGLASISRAPVIGLFRDKLGSYDNLFRILGAFIFISAISWTVEDFYTRKRQRGFQTLS